MNNFFNFLKIVFDVECKGYRLGKITDLQRWFSRAFLVEKLLKNYAIISCFNIIAVPNQ